MSQEKRLGNSEERLEPWRALRGKNASLRAHPARAPASELTPQGDLARRADLGYDAMAQCQRLAAQHYCIAMVENGSGDHAPQTQNTHTHTRDSARKGERARGLQLV